MFERVVRHQTADALTEAFATEVATEGRRSRQHLWRLFHAFHIVW